MTAANARPRARQRFALCRYYAIYSLICTLVIAAALGWTYQFFALRDLVHLAGDRNAALTQAFSNSLWPRFAHLVDRGAGAAELRALAEADNLYHAVARQMRGTEVIKVKIYGLDGITAFSSDPSQTGQDKNDNSAFKAAAAGELTTGLAHRDSFDAFEGTLTDLDVISTYLPIRDEADRIVAVFEIYSDVSDLMRQLAQTRSLLIASVIGLLGLLYGLLYLLVARAQDLIDAQADTLDDYLARIEIANRDLDQRVQERTATLTAMNFTLRREIDERCAAEEKLRLAARVFENSIEGITITDAEQQILAVNPAFTQVTGYAEAEVLGKTPRILQSGRQEPAFYAALWASIKNHGRWQGEMWNRRKNGEIFPEWLSISAVQNAQHEVSHYVAVFSDITAIKDTQAKLEHLAHHDPLTRLPNRLYFQQRLTQAIALARRTGRRLAVLFLDLDHFKHVNDTLGHEIGDQLLCAVTAKLQPQLRDTDTLARLGGDEFTLIVEDVDNPRGVAQLAHKLVAAVAAPFAVGEHELFVTASIGISLYPEDGEDVDTLVKHADTAMYEAKAHGRNAYHFYAPEMTAFAVERLQLESLLRRSVGNGELSLAYQPQIDLLSGELVGAEALVRWHHPSLGLVPPVRFIHIAEESGQIGEIGAWVLREACRQFAAWRAARLFLPKVAINVSARQLERGNFAQFVRRTLTEFSLPAACIELELTESAIMATENAYEILEELAALGIELAIDDFGTGYSSLSLLKRLPIGKLKIDRSFIADVADDANDAAIVRSVIALAEAMGLATVAEGVETDRQIDFLRQEGCSQIQGFLISRPVGADEMATLLTGSSETQIAVA